MTSPRFTLWPGLTLKRAEVAVASRQAERVLEHEQIPVVAGIGRRFDDAVGGREDRLAFFGRDVETLMERRLAS